MIKLIVLGLICCITGCYNSIYECGARKAVAANKIEEKAIAHATKKLESTCNKENVFCDFVLSRDLSNDIWIHVAFKFPYTWGRCEQAGDGFIDYVYDENGNFLYTSTEP